MMDSFIGNPINLQAIYLDAYLSLEVKQYAIII